MPRKKKSARDMTSEELAKKVFPAKVKRELDRVAHEGGKKGKSASKRKGKSSP